MGIVFLLLFIVILIVILRKKRQNDKELSEEIEKIAKVSDYQSPLQEKSVDSISSADMVYMKKYASMGNEEAMDDLWAVYLMNSEYRNLEYAVNYATSLANRGNWRGFAHLAEVYNTSWLDPSYFDESKAKENYEKALHLISSTHRNSDEYGMVHEGRDDFACVLMSLAYLLSTETYVRLERKSSVFAPRKAIYCAYMCLFCGGWCRDRDRLDKFLDECVTPVYHASEQEKALIFEKAKSDAMTLTYDRSFR